MSGDFATFPTAAANAALLLRYLSTFLSGTPHADTVAMDVFQLSIHQNRKAAPGYRILVIDHGGVRLDIPMDWIVYSPNRFVFIIDRFPPNNRVLLTIACARIGPEIEAISLQSVLDEWISSEYDSVLEAGPVTFGGTALEAIWVQVRVQNRDTDRDKCARLCVARANRTQAILVFEFDPAEELRLESHWNKLVDTVVVGEYELEVGVKQQDIPIHETSSN